MVWASNNFLGGRIRIACPVMEMWHVYKKLLEDIWKTPELFYTFWAPLAHCFYPDSAVFVKPKLKMIESYFTAIRLVWGECREAFLQLIPTLTPLLKPHFMNILLITEFFIPVVSSTLRFLLLF